MTVKEIDFRDSDKIIIGNIRSIDDKDEIVEMNDAVFRWMTSNGHYKLFKEILDKFKLKGKMASDGILANILAKPMSKIDKDFLKYLIDKDFRVEADYLNVVAADYNIPVFQMMLSSKYLKGQIKKMRDKDFIDKIFQEQKKRIGVFADLLD